MIEPILIEITGIAGMVEAVFIPFIGIEIRPLVIPGNDKRRLLAKFTDLASTEDITVFVDDFCLTVKLPKNTQSLESL